MGARERTVGQNTTLSDVFFFIIKRYHDIHELVKILAATVESAQVDQKKAVMTGKAKSIRVSKLG